MPQLPVDFSQVSVGVAALGGLIYVARTMQQLVRDVLQFLHNHLSQQVQVLRDLTAQTERHTEAVRHLADEIRDLKRS